MFELILYQPEIPPNTGNIIRLCANTGTRLHLVEPLGFELDAPRLRRAGLDYRELASVAVHRTLPDCLRCLGGPKIYALSSRGQRSYATVRYTPGDVFLLGPETRGLPAEVLERVDAGRRLRIPMRTPCRSLNLSNAAAVVVYEAWRQQEYAGGD